MQATPIPSPCEELATARAAPPTLSSGHKTALHKDMWVVGMLCANI
jgi:hypothetical protein